jgi:hypothetical protein
MCVCVCVCTLYIYIYIYIYIYGLCRAIWGLYNIQVFMFPCLVLRYHQISLSLSLQTHTLTKREREGESERQKHKRLCVYLSIYLSMIYIEWVFVYKKRPDAEDIFLQNVFSLSIEREFSYIKRDLMQRTFSFFFFLIYVKSDLSIQNTFCTSCRGHFRGRKRRNIVWTP